MQKGLSVDEAFLAFNASNTGWLTCSELHSALKWAGLELQVEQVHSIGADAH